MSNKKNEKLDEYEIFLAYLNDAEDELLTDEILSSKQACEQLSQLQNDMNTIENTIAQYQPDEEFGARMWHEIAGKLDAEPKKSWLHNLLSQLQQPRFSLAGLMSIVVIAVTFFVLGQNQSVNNTHIENIAHTASYEKLLAQNVGLHLAQTDAFLTQISNMQTQHNSAVFIETAESLLLSNRIFRNAYAQNDNKRLQYLLTELEKVLVEIANGNAHFSKDYIQDYTNDELLFKVKSTRQKLKSQVAQHNQSTSI